MNNRSLSIVVPALNEEANLKDAIDSICLASQNTNLDWEVVLVNDGSSDRTGQIADELAINYKSHIKVLHHECTVGIGGSIWEGVIASSKDAVTWLPGDGENEPAEIIKYLPLLDYVDFIVPFVINRNARSSLRQFLSKIFLLIINFSFGTNFNYTNGNVIYKKCIFEKVIQESKGFLFQAECLIKASRLGFIFAEVPIRIRGRIKGHSKATSFRSLAVLFQEYLKLLFYVYRAKKL